MPRSPLRLLLVCVLLLSACQQPIINQPNTSSSDISSSSSAAITTSSTAVSMSSRSATTKSEKLNVSWLPKEEKIVLKDYVQEKGVLEKDIVASEALSEEFYKVGVVSDGQYESGDIVLRYSHYDSCLGAKPDDGPCGGPYTNLDRLLITPNKTVIVIEGYSQSQGPYGMASSASNKKFDLDLYPPTSIQVPNSSNKLQFLQSTIDLGVGKLASLFTSSDGWTVFDGHTCLYVENKDHTLSVYLIDFNSDREGLNIQSRPDIVWSNGTTGTGIYIHGRYSCSGDVDCYDVADVQEDNILDHKTLHGLEQIGQTKSGNPVFREVYSPSELASFIEAPREKNAPPQYDWRDYQICDNQPSVLSVMYCHQYTGSSKMTPEQFYDSNPVIYIKDPFNRYLTFNDETFAPAVECGKPVIYLYPTKEEDIDVQVKPSGGMTITDPAYGNGWHVRATPSGSIYNYADAKNYPYLFWEGKGIDYSMPTEGFVIASKDMAVVLGKKLADQGLNDHEIADFMEYWLPKLQAKPYYFITFVPQKEFDVLAPLTISPRPDTVIRVFMDYKGLDAPINVKPLELRKIERKGLTVVEWGGALHRQ